MRLYRCLCIGIMVALGVQAIELEELPPDVQADIHLEEARLCIEAGQWEEALGRLRGIAFLTERPPADYFLFHARVLANLEQPKDAMASLLMSLELSAADEAAIVRVIPTFLEVKNQHLPAGPVAFPAIRKELKTRLLTASSQDNEAAERWAHAAADYAQLESLGAPLPEAFQFLFGRALIRSERHHAGVRRLNRFLADIKEERELTRQARELRVQANEELDRRQAAWDAINALDVSGAAYPSIDKLYYGAEQAQQRQHEIVAELGLPLEIKHPKSGLVMRLIPAGRFKMGSPSWSTKHHYDERLHEVTITHTFYMSVLPVTKRQWQAVMNGVPVEPLPEGEEAGPAVQIEKWEDTSIFMDKLCQLEGLPPGTFRLPTEAEWEYAARAGTYCFYHSLDVDIPNAWGLQLMIGGIPQWCSDWYGEYPEGPVIDPQGPSWGAERVRRGGKPRGVPAVPLAYRHSARRPSPLPGHGIREIHTTPGIRVVGVLPPSPID